MHDERALDITRLHGASNEVRGGEGRTAIHQRPKSLLVAVPLYRTPELVPVLVEAFLAQAAELRLLSATILFVNDSPDDASLNVALETACASLEPAIAVDVLVNPENLGFIASANRALEIGLASDRDIILLNSDALPRPGAFAEMLDVAYLDPLVSVVSPRSDNATICNSPVAPELRGRGRDQDWEAHRIVAAHLPRFTYVPTAVGFCLLVRRAMVAEFGLFDPVYGLGYNEENDFIRRCNQCGYRAVLANHAYVHHIGESSFDKTDSKRADRDRKNREILSSRYPEYDRALSRHLESAEHRAEYVLGGLVPIDGKLGVLFDCRVMGSFFNGTFEHLIALLRAFAAQFGDRYDLRILCSEKAFAFHQLGSIPGLALWTERDALRRPSAVAFRMSQPDAESVATLPHYAAVTGAFMLDTIAMDCQQLDQADLHGMLTRAVAGLDLIGFNSAFTRDQFVRRFRVPEHTVQFVSLCSTDPADYPQPKQRRSANGGILLVGNHFPHKNVLGMLRALERVGSTTPLTVLGIEVDEPGVAASYRAGQLPQDLVERLYEEAGVLLFPSHYEGFGLPIMRALARRIPVIARDLPCAREIKATCPAGANLHLCASTDDMAALAVTPLVWRDDPEVTNPERHDWNAAAAALATAFEEGIRRFDFGHCTQHHVGAQIAEPAADFDFVVRQGAGGKKGKSFGRTVSRKVGAATRFIARITGRARALRRRRHDEWNELLVLTAEDSTKQIFDAEWYLSTYSDVRELEMDALYHYVHHGASENRDPGPNFRAAFYLAAYPKAAASGMNPLLHYLKHGRAEGFATNPREYRIKAQSKRAG